MTSAVLSFNVKVTSLELGNFEATQVEALYAQHTAESGQAFAPEAVARAIELTGGQPWLANALGYEIVDRMAIPPKETITIDHIEEAKSGSRRAFWSSSIGARMPNPCTSGSS